jgi:hypothetical protein
MTSNNGHQSPGLSLPADSFKPSPDQVLVINQATTSLVNACMQRFGFTSVLPPASKSAPETLARRYGVTDAKIAATYGYHLALSERVVADRKTSPTTPTPVAGTGAARCAGRACLLRAV